jgi:hypothetical protein
MVILAGKRVYDSAIKGSNPGTEVLARLNAGNMVQKAHTNGVYQLVVG